MKYYFDTLNEALDAEGLIEAWDISFPAIDYGETRRWIYYDGSPRGRLCFVARTTSGVYERPVSYRR